MCGIPRVYRETQMPESKPAFLVLGYVVNNATVGGVFLNDLNADRVKTMPSGR